MGQDLPPPPIQQRMLDRFSNLTNPWVMWFQQAYSRMGGANAPSNNQLGLNPMSDLGDIIVGGAAGTETRLPGNKTTTRQFLVQTGSGSSSAFPEWSDIENSDVPPTDLASSLNGGVTGILPIASGGTNSAAPLNNDCLMVSVGGAIVEATALTPLSPVLTDASGLPTTGQIDLTSQVANILPIASGGTNSGTALSNDRVMVSSGGEIIEAAALTPLSPVLSDASGLPTSGQIDLTSQVTGALPISNGGTGQITAGAAFNALSPMSAKGDLIAGGTSGSGTSLPVGADGDVLTADSTQTLGIKWAPPSGGGSSLVTFTTVTTNTSLSASFNAWLSDSSSGALLHTFPAASSSSGLQLTIKDIGTGGFTTQIQGGGSDLIDGSNLWPTDLNANDSVTVFCDGTGWHVI